MNAFASLRQRNNETLLDYLQRFKSTLEYFNLADPTYTPKEPIQAIKFLTNLDPTLGDSKHRKVDLGGPSVR